MLCYSSCIPFPQKIQLVHQVISFLSFFQIIQQLTNYFCTELYPREKIADEF